MTFKEFLQKSDDHAFIKNAIVADPSFPWDGDSVAMLDYVDSRSYSEAAIALLEARSAYMRALSEVKQ